MRLHTAGMLMLGAALCGGGVPAAADGDALPAFASRDFFDTLQRFDEPPSEVAARAASGATVATAPDTASATGATASSEAGVTLLAQATVVPPATQPKPLPQVAAPPPPGEAPASWPKTLPEAKAETNARIDLATYWPESEVNLAQARCTAILKSLDAVTMPEPPMRHGACGAPAPVRLISIGKKPEVALTPPPLVTCDMVQALHAWITKDVQPAARRTLATNIVSMELMSDYSCRNAYGSRSGRLSEHARANALDIRGFLNAKGEMLAFLEDWGPTGREIREIAQREKAEAARLAAQKAAEPKPSESKEAGKTPPALAPTAAEAAAAAASTLTRSTIVEGLAQIPSGPMGAKEPPTVGFAVSHLGGPKPMERIEKRADDKSAAAVATPPNVTGRAAFLRELHASACKIFGTVLGPEANRAHRNHLHVDMADRTTGVFCE